MKIRGVYYKISFLFLFLTSILGSVYRSYIYNNNINDYGLADMHTNIGSVVTASFLFMGYVQYKEYKDELKVILGVVLGFIVYEVIQSAPLIGVFDWKDVIGTIIGGILTFVIHKLITIKYSL
ncbi:MAG: hypothetical protein N4A57_00180 [Anaeromicrobium sp.]|uniref:hypothetical protein n=1 Tax=Anaeromicrobium sp. TaxID=1929132 RepID=UPI0025DD5899|nr:hypothetical protein [Anaeromicrobium sp.]MCT4592680.1 hypothetical protein [Anaeromicrobium sp.]